MTLENFNEMQERVENGEEFSFDYKNEEYWISQNPDEYYITRVRGSLTQEFDTSKALLKMERLREENFSKFIWVLIGTNSDFLKGVHFMKFTCPCCGYKTLNEEPPDTYEICEICFWEDDGYQYKYPDEDGANNISFSEAQQNFIKFGVSEGAFSKNVRKPKRSD